MRATSEVKEEMQLGDGRTNQNFIVDMDGSRFFVRIGSDLPFFGVARPREQAASRAAEAAGLAPGVRHTELPDVLVLDFVDGRALTEADVRAAAADGRSNEILTAITSAIRRLHDVPIPAELTAFLEEAGENVGWGGPHLAKWLAYAEDRGFSRLPLLDGLRDRIAELEAAAGPLGEDTPPRFCHFDLLADNFVLKAGTGEVFIVDFEYTAPGQPLMDLAVLAMGCSLERNEEYNLLSSFLGVEADEAQVYGFKALRVLAALRETFWGVTAELSESSALTLQEARDYVDLNYNKFRQLSAEFEYLPPPSAATPIAGVVGADVSESPQQPPPP